MGGLSTGFAGLGMAGAGINAFGQLASGEANANVAMYQAQVAQNAAQTARINTTLDSGAGEYAATVQGMKTRAAIGKQQAFAGASGVQPNVGSEAAVKAGMNMMGRLDAATIRSNAARKEYADEVQATNYENQSALYSYESNVASTMAPITAAGSLLSGAATTGLNWQKLQLGSN